MKKQAKSKAERQAELMALEKGMWEQVESYMDDPVQLLEYLKFISRFPQYSVHNRMLIASQREGAVAVGSFGFYKAQGIKIKKGERALKVLAPCQSTIFKRPNGGWISLKYATQAEKDAIATGELKKVTWNYYRPVPVFDVTQTDLPKEKYPAIFPNLHVDYATTAEFDRNAVYEGAVSILNRLGVVLTTVDESAWDGGNAKGYYAPGTKEIVLNPANTATENSQVLLHELAHAILHSKEENAVQRELSLEHHRDLMRHEKELQAEMTSYLICQANGVDTTAQTTRYIAHWTAKGQNIKRERLAVFFDEIVKVAEYVNGVIADHKRVMAPAVMA